MKIKTADLTGPALDWAVAKCDEISTTFYGRGLWYGPEPNDYRWEWGPSTNWSQGGPIIEREGITVGKRYAPKFLPKHSPPMVDWTAQYFEAPHSALEVHRQFGPTPLIAAMRCYVASRLGDEVDIPEELL